MGWDGSGNYTRVHDWTTDRDAAINIDATRMDAEMDDQATAIGACLTKNNESKPTANFLPNADATYDLGSAAAQWRHGFFSGNLTVTGSLINDSESDIIKQRVFS